MDKNQLNLQFLKARVRQFPGVSGANELEEVEFGFGLNFVRVSVVDHQPGDVVVTRAQALGRHCDFVHQQIAFRTLYKHKMYHD
jgi:hypothetical protein